MADNDKLLTSLRINLKSLQEDVTKANSILKSLTDLELEAVNIDSGKEAIKLLRLIQDEFKKINTVSTVKIDTKSIDDMEKKLKGLGVTLKETLQSTTKSVTTVLDDGGNPIKKTIKEEISLLDELGREYKKVNSEITGAGDSTTKINTESVTNNVAKHVKEEEKLALAISKTREEIEFKNKEALKFNPKTAMTSIETNYNKLSSSGVEKIADLQEYTTKIETLIKDYNLEGDALKSATALKKKYNDESIKISDNLDKQAKASSKKSITDEIGNIKTAYNQLNTSGNERVESLKSLNIQTDKLLKNENLETSSIVTLTGLQKTYTKEINNVAEATKKLNLESLKQYTQEQLQAGYGAGNKTMTDRLGSISGASKNQTLGSGDVRNSTFVDRFNVAKDYVVSSKIFNMAFNSMDQAYNSIAKYEEGLVDLSRTLSNVSDNDLKNFGKEAIQASKDFGVPLEQVQAAYTELARAGVDNKDDLASMVKSVLTGINTTEIKDAATLTSFLVSTVKQLGMSYQDTNKIIDSWNMLSDKYAVKSNDFAEAIQKSGSASKSLGLGLNDLNAMVVVLGEATQKSGSEVGSAVKTLETRLLRPETVATLEGMGIAVKKDAEHFNSFQTIMAQVNTKMDEFGEGSIKANELMDNLGGAWRRNDIAILANGWDQINQISKESLGSSGYSIAENEKAMKTLTKQVETLKNVFAELFISFGESGVLDQLKFMVSQAAKTVSAFSSIPPSVKNTVIVLAELAVAYKAINSVQKMITGQDFKQWLDMLLPKIGGFSKVFGDGNASMRAFQMGAKSLGDSLSSGNINIDEYSTILGELGKQCGVSAVGVDQLKLSKAALDKQLDTGKITQVQYNEQLEKLATTTKTASIANKAHESSQKAVTAAKKSTLVSTLALNVATIASTLLISAAIAGIYKLADALIITKKELKEMNEATKSAMDAISKNATTSQSSLNRKVEIEELLKGNLAIDEQSKLEKELYDIKVKLGEMLPGAVSSINAEGKAIADNNVLIQKQIDLEKERVKAKADAYLKDNSKFNILGNDIGSKATKTGNDISRYEQMKTASDQGRSSYDEILGTNAQGKVMTKSVKFDQTDMSKLKIAIEDNKLSLMEWDMMYSQASDSMKAQLPTYESVVTKINSMSSSTDSNTNSIKANALAQETNVMTAEQIKAAQEALQKSFQDSTAKIEDYQKILHDLKTNDSELKSATMKNLAKDHIELLPYLKDEKMLIDKVTEALETEKNTANQAYREMMMSNNDYYNSTIKGTNIVKNALGDYYNQLSASQKNDLANAKNLAEAKVIIERELISRLAKAWDSYNSAVARTLSRHADLAAQMDSGDPYAEAQLSKFINNNRAVQNALTDARSIQSQIDGINTSFNNIGANINNPFTYGNTYAGSDAKAGSKDSNTVDNLSLEIDRYTRLNAVISTLNNTIDMNNKLYDQASYADKISLLNQEIVLLDQKKIAIKNLTAEQIKEMNELKANLSGNGFGFDSSGQVTNQNDRLLQFQNSANSKSGDSKTAAIENVKALQTEVERYNELVNSLIPGSNSNWQDVANEINTVKQSIKDLNRESLENVKEVQNQVIEMLQKQIEDKKKSLDDDLKLTEDHFAKLKEIESRQYSEQDYNKGLKKELDAKKKLQAEIEQLADDTSREAQSKLEDLKAQLLEQQTAIDDMQEGHARDSKTQAYDDMLKSAQDNVEAQKKALDDQYTDTNLQKIADDAVKTGVFNNLNGEVVNVQTAFTTFFNATAEGMSATGKLVQEEFIDKLKLAEETAIRLSALMPNLSAMTVSSILPSLQLPSLSIPKFAMPDMSMLNNNQNIPTVNNFSFDHLVQIDGNVMDTGNIKTLIIEGVQTGLNGILGYATPSINY